MLPYSALQCVSDVIFALTKHKKQTRFAKVTVRAGSIGILVQYSYPPCEVAEFQCCNLAFSEAIGRTSDIVCVLCRHTL
jgi:hypothetical protein